MMGWGRRASLTGARFRLAGRSLGPLFLTFLGSRIFRKLEM